MPLEPNFFNPATETSIGILFDDTPGSGNYSHNLEIIFKLIEQGFRGHLRIIYLDHTRDKVGKIFNTRLSRNIETISFPYFFGIEALASVTFVPWLALKKSPHSLAQIRYTFSSSSRVLPPHVIASTFLVSIPAPNFTKGSDIRSQADLAFEPLLAPPRKFETEIPFLPSKPQLFTFLRAHGQSHFIQFFEKLLAQNPFIIAPYFNRSEEFGRETYTLALANLAAVMTQQTAKRPAVILSLYRILQPKLLLEILQGHSSYPYPAEDLQAIRETINSNIAIKILSPEEYSTHTATPNELIIISSSFIPSPAYKILASLAHLLIAEGANNSTLRLSLGLPLFHYDFYSRDLLQRCSIAKLQRTIASLPASDQSLEECWQKILTTAQQTTDNKIGNTFQALAQQALPQPSCSLAQSATTLPGWNFLAINTSNARLSPGENIPTSDIACRVRKFKKVIQKTQTPSLQEFGQFLIAVAEKNVTLAKSILQKSPEILQQNLANAANVLTNQTTAKITDTIGIAIANQDHAMLALLKTYGMTISAEHHHYFAKFTSYKFYQAYLSEQQPNIELIKIALAERNYSFLREWISVATIPQLCKAITESQIDLEDEELGLLLLQHDCLPSLSYALSREQTNAFSATLYWLSKRENKAFFNRVSPPSFQSCHPTQVVSQLAYIMSEPNLKNNLEEFSDAAKKNCLGGRDELEQAQCIAQAAPSADSPLKLAKVFSGCLTTKKDNANPVICYQEGAREICTQFVPETTKPVTTTCRVGFSETATNTQCIEAVDGGTLYTQVIQPHSDTPTIKPSEAANNYWRNVASGAGASAAIGFFGSTLKHVGQKISQAMHFSPQQQKAVSISLPLLMQLALTNMDLSQLLPTIGKVAISELLASVLEKKGYTNTAKMMETAAPVAISAAFEKDLVQFACNTLGAIGGSLLAHKALTLSPR